MLLGEQVLSGEWCLQEVFEGREVSLCFITKSNQLVLSYLYTACVPPLTSQNIGCRYWERSVNCWLGWVIDESPDLNPQGSVHKPFRTCMCMWKSSTWKITWTCLSLFVRLTSVLTVEKKVSLCVCCVCVFVSAIYWATKYINSSIHPSSKLNVKVPPATNTTSPIIHKIAR